MSPEEAQRGVAVEQCLYQIDQCLKLIENPNTKAKTRLFRIQLLKIEAAKLSELQPDHPMISPLLEMLRSLPPS